ncbi:dTDP-glucose 4,6-dehydratase [[Eubacterium] cellulosolvens]
MHLLVTGGLGFIGSNFIKYMLEKQPDIEITNLDKISYGANPANLQDIEDNKNYRFIKGDICDKRDLKEYITNSDVIVNFAAESHVDRSISDPSPFLRSNTEGVLSLLEVIRNHNEKIKVIQVGTDESYGDILKNSFNEEDRLKPSSPYAASKASADMLCLAYYRTYGLDIIISRCTNNFGPYQFPEKLIPKTIIRANLNLKIPIYGSGMNVRDWIYVKDHCDAINKIMKKGKSGEIYNISSGNELANIEIVDDILRLLNKPKELIEFVEDRPGHDVRYSLDSSKIRKELNWKPTSRFSKALKETINWYIDNEPWWKSLAKEEIIHPTPWKLKWKS